MERYEPLISILVPCYNNQKFIYDLLTSIFKQTYHNLEVLIGDDGSEEFATREIVDWLRINKPKWIKRVSVFQNETNIGTVANMENLVSKANGEFFFNIAADDVLFDSSVMEKFVERINEIIADGEEPHVIMTQLEMWDHTLENKLEDFIPEESINLLVEGSPRELFAKSAIKPFLPAQYLYDRKAVELIGKLSDHYKLIEDWPAALRLCRQGVKIHYMDSVPSAKHRDGGISHGNSLHSKKIFIQYYMELVECYYNEIEPYQDLLTEEEQALARENTIGRTKALYINHIPQLKQQLVVQHYRAPEAETPAVVPATPVAPAPENKPKTVKQVIKEAFAAVKLDKLLLLAVLSLIGAGLIQLKDSPLNKVLFIALVVLAGILLVTGLGKILLGLFIKMKKRRV